MDDLQTRNLNVDVLDGITSNNYSSRMKSNRLNSGASVIQTQYPRTPSQPDLGSTTQLILLAVLSSIGLAAVKITTGIIGNSYALIADGIESLTDVVTSIAVLVGMILSLRPPDDSHPWGHGKLETFSMLFVSAALLSAAGLIAWQAIHEIIRPHQVPSWFTLPILVLIVILKVLVSRAIARRGIEQGSKAMEADAWHHLSDAITSGATFIGITIAVIGGPGWESADDWAALIACSIIVWNGIRLVRVGIMELLETRAPATIEDDLRSIALGVVGVHDVEKLRARKSGMGIVMDIHIEVDGDISVTEGHNIAGAVKTALLRGKCQVVDVTVHVEPHNKPIEPAPDQT